MADLSRGTSEWSGSVDQTYQNKTYTFSTKNKVNDRDIAMTINVPGMNVSTPTSSTNNTFYITIGGVTYNWEVDSSGNVWVS